MLASVGFKYHTVFRQAFKKTTTLRKDNADRLAAFTSLQRKRDINKPSTTEATKAVHDYGKRAFLFLHLHHHLTPCIITFASIFSTVFTITYRRGKVE